MDVGACRSPGCASTRPWAVFCNPFGVDGRWGLSFPRVREYATLGCALQPLWGKLDVGPVPSPGGGGTQPWGVFCNPFGVIGRWGFSFPRVRGDAALACVLQPFRGRWTLGLVVPQGARVRDPGLCSATPSG